MSASGTEQQLQLAASVFVHAREGIMITDADGAIIDVNDTFTRITGYSREEALGAKTRASCAQAAMTRFLRRHVAQLAGQGALVWRNLREQRKNGEIFAEMETISAVCATKARASTTWPCSLTSR